LGLDWLNVEVLICSPLPTGGGTVRCEHGLLPVPAPAVLNMMATAHMPVYSNGIERELVTPTGCAIATTLAQSFGPPPKFTLQKIGLGAGSRELPLPNILRLWIGTTGTDSDRHQTAPADTPQKVAQATATATGLSNQLPDTETPVTETPVTETIVELQTQLDDISPQAIAYVFDRLFAKGAVDVFTQPVAMKKSRLGTLLTVLCPESAVADCEALLFRETTTLGIRQTRQVRSVLAREMVTVATPYGDIAVKVARSRVGGSLLNVQPEYEDCAAVARSQDIPWQQVHQAAMEAAGLRLRSALGLGFDCAQPPG
jgi:pyridinium-3,5-bisthiocarboxylic acid mononucleotide nickel chelatase